MAGRGPSVDASCTVQPPRVPARALELAAAGAALTDVLSLLAEIVEEGCDGLSLSISIVDDHGDLFVARDSPAIHWRSACTSTPIRSESSALLGTMTTFADRVRPVSERERELVESAVPIARLAVELARLRDSEASHRGLVERMPAVAYIADPGIEGRWHYVSPQVKALLGYAREDFMSDAELWVKRLHPDDRERVIAEEAGVVRGAAHASASEYRMRSRSGDVVWIRDDALLVRDDLGRLRWHGVLSDVTARKQAEAEIERRVAQQAAVARLGEHALEGAALVDLMDEALAAVARILEVEIGSILELAPDGDSFVVRAALGWGEVGTSRLPAHRNSQSGYTVDIGRPVVVTDWQTERRFRKPETMRGVGTRSGLTAIIEGADGPFGVLGVQCLHCRDYSAGDIDFVQALANVLADAIQRQATEDGIRHRALHDALTGLPNRVLFLDRLSHAFARVQRREHPVAMLFLDLDHFKLVNDSLGHHAGDELLVAVADRLRTTVRPSDTVARFGGDEFGILLEEMDNERSAAEVAERIAAAFAHPFVLGGSDHFVTASVGIAVADSPDQVPETLIRDADSAMYRAKERGRARYELFDEAMRARAVARLRVENDLRRAIERGELHLDYQPVVSLGDGSIKSVEALVRWAHPERGSVGPDEFIPVAEDCGLIEPIGRWVLEQACRQAAQWHEANPDSAPVGISVNLSARQVAQQRDLPGSVARVLRATGLDPGCLSLEITETVLLEDSDVLTDMLRELRRMGVLLVLDDFGTGYSSLGYLNRLPLDALKVDRSFVDGLGTKQRDSAIVKAVIAMAQALSLGVIAEGVETHAQLEELRRLGCDRAQGYYFARPVPAQEIGVMLREGMPASEARSRHA